MSELSQIKSDKIKATHKDDVTYIDVNGHQISFHTNYYDTTLKNLKIKKTSNEDIWIGQTSVVNPLKMSLSDYIDYFGTQKTRSQLEALYNQAKKQTGILTPKKMSAEGIPLALTKKERGIISTSPSESPLLTKKEPSLKAQSGELPQVSQTPVQTTQHQLVKKEEISYKNSITQPIKNTSEAKDTFKTFELYHDLIRLGAITAAQNTQLLSLLYHDLIRLGAITAFLHTRQPLSLYHDLIRLGAITKPEGGCPPQDYTMT